MIIRFENLDDFSYSAQFTFDSNGFKCAEYDYSDFVDVVDPDLSTENSFTDFLRKSFYNIFTYNFVESYLNPHWENNWNSFKISFSDGSYYYSECFNKWNQNNSYGSCGCFVSNNPDSSFYCPDNSYSDFVEDSWTSGYCLKVTENIPDTNDFNITWYNFLDTSNISDLSCSNIGKFPTISFVEPDINYPKFKIFAYDFENFENDDCKYSLFLHILSVDSDNQKKCKTIKVGGFGVYKGDFYFENFYGIKVFNFVETYFDFYTFFNTTIQNPFNYMKDNYNDFSDVNINSFGNTFVFELKKEDYSGVYMSALDCECLSTAINSLNTTLESLLKNSSDDNIVDVLDDFHKSFTHAFNKTLITEQSSFGSGSVFKSNDLDDHDYYYLIDNKGKSCDYPLNVNLCPFTFSEVPVKINSIPALDVDIDTMPTSRLVTHVNSAVDISCICDELGDIDEGLVAGFTAQGVLLTSVVTSVNELAKKFVTGCDTTIASAFSEAFNLTNCHGSVFKANDDNWNGEDTLAGILYKQLDYDYLSNNLNYTSAFYSNFRVFNSSSALPINIPSFIRYIFIKNSFIGEAGANSVFKTSSNFSISNLLRNALFINGHGLQDTPNFDMSVFSSGFKNSNEKILFHSCDNNPCSIKFCDNSLPVDVVNSSGSPVKVEMEPTSSINVNVDSAPSDPANIYINADGKTFLNNNNFR